MQKELQIGWVDVVLEDLFSHVTGGDWGLDPETEGAEGFSKVVCIRGGELRNWRVDKGKTASIRLVKDSSINTRRLKIGDILLEISGGGPDQPVGRTVIIDEEVFKNHPELPKVCTNFLRLVRLVDVVNKQYINQYLQYFYSSGEVVKYQGGSNNLRNLKFGDYSSIKIPLPPLPEQQRMVAKLDRLFGHLDALKTCLDRIPQLLKDFRQKVLTQAVTGQLTEGWREGRELGEWKTEIASVCCDKVQSGGTPKGGGFTDEGIPFLKVYNIVNNQIDFEYRPQFVTIEVQNKALSKSIAYPGDVLMNIVGPPLNKIAILPADYPEWNLNQAITLFRTKKYLLNTFLYYFFCEGKSVREVMGETKGVVGQINISLSQCRDFEIPIPPFDEQQEIVRRVESLFAKADQIEAGYQKLKAKIEQLPQALLAKAFHGELVQQLPTDGDARDLLEQIKQAKAGLGKGGKTKKMKGNDKVRMVAEKSAKYGSR